jgi:hypothetical protein
MRALVLNAKMFHHGSLISGERDFQGAIACIDIAATLALGTMIKKQAEFLKVNC